jgi:hypothetical protein
MKCGGCGGYNTRRWRWYYKKNIFIYYIKILLNST